MGSWVLCCFGLKTGLEFTHFAHFLDLVFGGTTGV